MGKKTPPDPKFNIDLSLYRGRWIAKLGNQVIGQGGTAQQAFRAAKNARSKETPQIIYVPMQKPFTFSPLFERVQEILGPSPSIYLVGGAIRNTLLSLPVHDLDFTLPAHTFSTARKIANRLGGAFFPLDEERETARVILSDGHGQDHILDFATFRGDTLEDDLRARDFTINAMAVSLQNPQALLDPLGGAADLRAGLLKSCSERTFQDDPLRILRAIRLAAQYTLHITPKTRAQIHKAILHIPDVSPERQRDELFRILAGPKQSSALKALDILGAFSTLFPNIPEFTAHAQRTLRHLEDLLKVLGGEHDPEAAGAWARGLAVLRLGRYRSHISSHLRLELVPERSRLSLIFLSALYNSGDDPQAGLLIQRAQALHLSNREINHLRAASQALERFQRLTTASKLPDHRGVYRYFHRLGEASLSAVFITLADFLAQEGSSPPEDAWGKRLDIARALLEAWWEHHVERISPPALLTGTDLMDALELSPGPLIGELLETIREAQAAGEITTRQAALSLAQNKIVGNS